MSFREKIKSINSREYTREEIINFLLYCVIIIVPLIFTKTKFVYISSKLVALYILGALLLFFGVKDIFLPMFKEKAIALVFLVSILIPSILSPYKQIAFLGSDVRGEGFVMYCIYILLFLVAIKYFKLTDKSINIVFFVASIISIYGVFQFYGIDPIQQTMLGLIFADGGSISTIGNRNFLSNYICIFLFISSAMYILKGQKKYLIFASIQFAGLLCTLTRGGWLSFLVFAAIGLLFIIKRKACLKRALILFFTLLLVFATINITTNNAIFERTDKEQIVSEDGELKGTVGERSEIYNICFKAIKDSPLIGFGPDTLKVRLLDDYPEDAIGYMLNHEVYIDKAHNEFIEYAVSDGIITFLCYLILISKIVIDLLKNKKDDISIVLFLTLIGYTVQGLFNISTIAVAPLYWILLGYCVQRTYKRKLNGKNGNKS